MDGWIKLHRKLGQPQSTFMQLNALQQAIAIHLLLLANHKDGEWVDSRKNIVVPIKRGQVVVSRERIIKWFPQDKVTSRNVRTALERLEKLGFLTKQATNAYTLITLVNYGVYQEIEDESRQRKRQQAANSPPASGQRNDPKQEVEEEKNGKKDKKKPYAEYVTMNEPEYRKLVDEYGLAQTLEMVGILNNYKGSTGKTYKDDYRAILSWVVDKVKEKRHANPGRRDEGHSAARQSITQGRSGRIRPGEGVPLPEMPG